MRTPDPASLSVERELPIRVGLGRTFERTLRVAGKGVGGLRCEVHESFPGPFIVVSRSVDGSSAPPARGAGGDGFDPSGGPDRGRFEGEEIAFARALCSRRRGVFRFGAVRVALRGRLGLVVRQSRWLGTQEIAVLPALDGLDRTLRLAASERWRDLGVRLLRRGGGETEFESLRSYVPGDDVRRVDWKAFARRGRPMVRTYQVERGQELFLLVDAGRRMRIVCEDGEGRGWTKLDWALDAALQLAAVALGRGDRVGCAAFTHGLEGFTAPARGSRQLERLLQSLFHRQASTEEADLSRALRELAIRHRRRATVVVLSDVADPLSVDAQRRALAAAARHHRIVFCALDDPDLRGALDPGARADLRAAAFELAAARVRSFRRLRGTGIRVLDPLPAEAAAPLLSAWLAERRA